MLKEQQIELIGFLRKTYNNIIFVIDPTENLAAKIYIVNEFRENDTSNKYFSFSGYKDISKIIDEASISFNTKERLEEIITSIEMTEIEMKERKFCDKFYWVKF